MRVCSRVAVERQAQLASGVHRHQWSHLILNGLGINGVSTASTLLHDTHPHTDCSAAYNRTPTCSTRRLCVLRTGSAPIPLSPRASGSWPYCGQFSGAHEQLGLGCLSTTTIIVAATATASATASAATAAATAVAITAVSVSSPSFTTTPRLRPLDCHPHHSNATSCTSAYGRTRS